MRLTLRGLALAACLLVLSPRAAFATTITYADLTSFQAASTTTLIDFAGLAPENFFTYYGVAPLTVGGVTFAGPEMAVVDDNYGCCAFPAGVAPATLFDNDPGAGVSFVITNFGSLTAAGFNIANTCAPSCSSPAGGTVTVALSNGFSTTFASLAGAPFVGFTTSDPFTSITISTADNPTAANFAELANFRYGSAAAIDASPVPEPATMTLLGLGLAGAAARRFRRKL